MGMLGKGCLLWCNTSQFSLLMAEKSGLVDVPKKTNIGRASQAKTSSLTQQAVVLCHTHCGTNLLIAKKFGQI